MAIIQGQKYGNPWDQVRSTRDREQRLQEGNIHGLSARQIEEMNSRMDSFLPQLATPNDLSRLKLPDGMSRSAQVFSGGGGAPSGVGIFSAGGGGDTYSTPQQPYQPEFASPDRQQYPVHRILANRYWRLFHKLDPVAGNVIDLYSEMLAGQAELTGEGVEGEIKRTYEEMLEKTKVFSLFPSFVREFLVLGEAVPHCFFDDDLGIWTFIAMHNPDQLEVIYSPFVNMEPIVEYIPDDKLRQILSSSDPMLAKVRASMPAEIVARLQARQNIPLDSLNMTFLARRLHPYDVRGTSIYSRLWRVFMYEDCIHPDTGVTLSSGIRKKAKDLIVGDKVLDRNGQEQNIEAVVKKNPQKLYEIKLFGGIEIVATGNHKWPVFVYPRTCQCGCGKQVSKFKSFVTAHAGKGRGSEWVVYARKDNAKRAQLRLPSNYNPYQKLETVDLRVDDYLMVPRKFEERSTDDTPEYARLLGYYLAEGSIRQLYDQSKFGVHFDFHVNETETWVKDIVSICEGLGVEAKVYFQRDRNGASIHIHKNEFSWLAEKLLDDGSEYSYHKQVSEKVMCWPVELKKELIKGYLRGDGSLLQREKPTKSFAVCVNTVSKVLADQIWLMCAQVGWPITHRRTWKPANNDGRNRVEQQSLRVAGKWVDGVAKEVFNVLINRSEREHNSWSKVWLDENYVYYPIKSLKTQEIETESIGITVSGDHSYIANGIATYNSVFSASIATARRHAGPIKIAKIGNPATGWIPGPEHEKRLLELLARAELDPHAFLVYHYGVQFEAFGTTDRMMSITREWDIIERMKLVALGVSKAFMHGEVTYASATTGLQVFLQRLLALRSFFETEWWYPKFFRPVAEINEWIKPTQAELSHRVRTKRTAAELEDADRYIVPTLMWDRKLDPHIDSALLGAVAQLEQLGVKISKGTKAAAGGFDYEDESRKVVEEMQFEQEIGIAPPPMMGMPGAPVMGAAPPQMQYGQEGEDESDNEREPVSEKNRDIEDLKILMVSGDTDNERWLPLMGTKEFEKMIYDGDMEGAWDYLQEYLVEMDDASDDEIEKIREELVVSKIIPPADIDKLKEMEANLPEDTGALQDDQIEDALSGKVIPIKPENKNDGLLSGMGGNPYRILNPSLSQKVKAPKRNNRPVKLETPEIDDPTNYKSREDWQKVLDRIPLSSDAKKYIKQLENSTSDGWEESFEDVWNQVENLLNQGMPVTSDTLLELMSSGSHNLRKNISKEDIKNSLMGIYHNGKMYAYEPTGFDKKKKELLAKRGFKKKSITIDTIDDHVILDTLVNSALGKVTSIGDRDLRQLILDRLTDPSMVEKNPLAIANEVVREERRRREEGTPGVDESSRRQLKDELKQLYEDQTWKIERIMRSEALGAYWTATLRGYREQGIRKIRFNSHHDNDTCKLCRGYDGTEFEIDELLALPSPLLAHLTHPNCRCWPTPVITGLTFEEFEKEYLADPDKFSDAYHGFDPDVLEIADVLKNVTTELTKFKDAPVEVAETLETLSDKVEGSPYQSEFPSNVQFVSDIAEHPEFVKAVAPEEDMRNQVVSWDAPSGVTYVSMFSMEQGDITSTMVRTWAQKIWDEHPEIQGNFREMYARAAVRTVPDTISSTTARVLVETYEPYMIGRKIWVDEDEGVGLNKRFRDMEDNEAMEALSGLGIVGTDADIIANWRKFNPTWNLDTGEFIETDIPNTVNKFVDAQAGESPQDMFIESLVCYVKDGIRLKTRDPNLYDYLKNEFFGEQEFIDTPAL